jgi:hypothetical protein
VLDIILGGSQGREWEDHLHAHTSAVRASAHQGDRRWVTDAESHARANPEGAFSFDARGDATLTAGAHRWHAGHFEVASIADLRGRAQQQLAGREERGRLRFFVLDGSGPATDIGALQATASPGTLFQIASQFNCLESPGPHLTPVSRYFHDPTQGPRASISAFPGTLLRHYASLGRDEHRFVQTPSRQLDLLARACGTGVVFNGYLTGQGISAPDVLAGVLDAHFEDISVGVHRDVQVVLGYDWDGGVVDSDHRRIAQVFTSTVAGGGYGGQRYLGARAFAAITCTLLRAAYLGTLLAAASLRHPRVVLTLVGGGAFGNPVPLIWDSILWALDAVAPHLLADLDVVLNGRNLGAQLDLHAEILPAVRARGGALVRLEG